MQNVRNWSKAAIFAATCIIPGAVAFFVAVEQATANPNPKCVYTVTAVAGAAQPWVKGNIICDNCGSINGSPGCLNQVTYSAPDGSWSITASGGGCSDCTPSH
jgi:hypothetical protein